MINLAQVPPHVQFKLSVCVLSVTFTTLKYITYNLHKRDFEP